MWLEQGQHKSGCTICVGKTKALISFSVTAKLICVFVFAFADCWFSHEAALILYSIFVKIFTFLKKKMFITSFFKLLGT